MLRHPPANNQRAVALFLSLGHHEALVRRLSSAFDERRKRLVQAISAFLPDWRSTNSAGGTSLWLEGPRGTDARGLADAAAARSVIIEPGDRFFDRTRQAVALHAARHFLDRAAAHRARHPRARDRRRTAAGRGLRTRSRREPAARRACAGTFGRNAVALVASSGRLHSHRLNGTYPAQPWTNPARSPGEGEIDVDRAGKAGRDRRAELFATLRRPRGAPGDAGSAAGRRCPPDPAGPRRRPLQAARRERPRAHPRGGADAARNRRLRQRHPVLHRGADRRRRDPRRRWPHPLPARAGARHDQAARRGISRCTARTRGTTC